MLGVSGCTRRQLQVREETRRWVSAVQKGTQRTATQPLPSSAFHQPSTGWDGSIFGVCVSKEGSTQCLDWTASAQTPPNPQQRVPELAKRYQRVLRRSLGREKQDPCCCVLTVSGFHLAFLKKARLGFDRKEIFSEVLLNLYLLFKENIRVFTENGSNSVKQGFCKYLTLLDVLFTF